MRWNTTTIPHIPWASHIREAKVLISTDSLAGKSEVLQLYGGLGSLNDVTLYDEGVPLIVENDRLHDMYEELYQELHRKS